MAATATASAAPRGLPAPAAGALAWPVKAYLVCLMLPIGFNLGPLYMTNVRLVLMALTIPALARLFSERAIRLHVTDFAFMIFVVWMAVALAVNNPDRVIQNTGSTGVEFLGGYLLGRVYIQDRAQFVTLCKWLSTLAAITLPLALLESQTGDPIVISTLWKLPGLRSEYIVTIPGRMGLERVQTVFAHPIHYGLFCSVAFSLTWVGLEGIYGGARRIVTSVVIGLCVFFSLSSGALLAMVLQLFLIGWFTAFRRVRARWWILFGLSVLAYVVIDLLSNRTPIRVFMSYATFSPHNAYWRGIIFEWGVMNIFGNAERGIPPAPIFGIGLDDWIRPHFMRSGSMDNFWLVMGVRYGMPGLLLVALGWLVPIFQLGARNLDGDAQFLRLRRAWMFTFVGLSFTLCTVHVWTSIYSFVFLFFGSGMWMLTAAIRRDGDEEDAEAAPAEAARDAPRSPYTRFPTPARDAVRPARAHAPRAPARPRHALRGR